ncbi:hypothetical protein BuS5_03384 [Desulfosarcina sp. BuS5]|uniref:hypothetical protein n=1 Tax=Desulfosarcina sp. BuS5 TaxID=933262 RepID=UPI000488494A|nr:hypothetical protein [Desulfosarcina sp. BuS5]WDN90413.1 hypothetical protein BuS5_03384 [Desulfosarcina sp. BuS5]
MGIRVWKLVAIIISMALFTGNTYLWAEEEEPKGLISAMSNMEKRPTASADVSVLSKYVWRGYELSDDSIVLALCQPGASTLKIANLFLQES